MGGEKLFLFYGGSSDSGSPPHGRGKVQDYAREVEAQRITPAWAGKSGSSAAVRSGAWDHPRVGEEKKALLTVRQALKGSPPRGRGKVKTAAEAIAQDGITPAWAGKRYALTGSETAG